MRKLILIFFSFFSLILNAQTADQINQLIENHQFKEASRLCEVLLKRKPKDSVLNLQYGRCQYELKKYDQAQKYLESVKNISFDKNYYLADSYYFTFDFDKALSTMQELYNTFDSLDVKRIDIEKKVHLYELAYKLMNRVELLTITDSILADKKDFLKYYQLSNESGTLVQNQTQNGSKTFDQISYFTQRGDRHIESKSINGNFDLLSSIKLLNDWSEPVSISNLLNTSANENYPFLMLDGVTLYYASDGPGSLGGYDIFVTRYNASTKDFVVPENVGFPFNSTANDYMLALDETGKTGWFATDRNQRLGKVMIYQFEMKTDKTYLSSSDSSIIKSVARLKKYNKSKKKVYVVQVADNQSNTAQKSNQFFIVNDTVTYYQSTQFVNTTAKTLYEEYLTLKITQDSDVQRLNGLRNKYQSAENTSDKLVLKPTVLQLESKVEAQTITLENLRKKIIALENRSIFLQRN